MTSKEESIRLCERCLRELAEGRGQFFEVRAEIIADPTPPVLDGELSKQDACKKYEELVSALGQIGPIDAMAQVYRRRIWTLCNSCLEAWLDDPFGRH